MKINVWKMLGWAILYFVAMLLGACAGFLHPFCWVYSAVLVALLGAWPYVRLTQSYPVFGMALLVAVVNIGLNMLGEGDGQFALIAILIGLLAEAVRKLGSDYDSESSVRLSYTVFALTPFANTLRMWISRDASMVQTVEEMGQEYADKMPSVLNPWLLALMVVLTMAVAWFSSALFYQKEKEV